MRNMPESITGRGWFSYRYAIPGFLFIIFLFLSNLELIVYGLLRSPFELNLAAVAAILTFFSGPAIGFLVTQIWYLLLFLFGRRLIYRKSEKMLSCLGIDVKSSSYVTDIDYWGCTTIENDCLYDYLTRRWDLINLLCSIISTMLFGLAVAYLVVRPMLLSMLSGPFSVDQTYFNSLIEYMRNIHVWIFIASFASIAILFSSVVNVRNEHQEMVIRIIQEQG